MTEVIKRGRFLMPVPKKTLLTPTDLGFEQIREIPVRLEKVIFPVPIWYAYFDFPPVEIAAGGNNMRIALQRVRWQMVYLLQTALEALEKPNPPLAANRQSKIIRQFINLS